MAAAFLLLVGVLLPCRAAFPQVKRCGMKINGAECAHHAECFSDCCLMDLDQDGSFCAPKTKIATVCLPQTKGAINVLCPCQKGLSCVSKDEMCPRRCRLI